MTASLEARVRELAEAAARPLGVERLGFCRLGDLPGLLPCRARRLLEGMPPESGVIVALLPYYAGEFPERNLARYALCDDYHAIAGEILQEIIRPLAAAFPGRRFLPFADNSPIPEVAAGVLAGLGFAGRNGQLITPWYGSYAFVGEIVTDLPLTPDGPGDFPGCGGCRRCLTSCPSGALGEAGLDRARCRSHITQKKGALTPAEAREVRLGGMAWGCDVCTDVCPYNRRPALTPILRMRQGLEPVLTRENLPDLLPRKSYGWRGREVLLRNLELLEGSRQAGEDSP